MNGSQKFPQHPLKNQIGKESDFQFSTWGQKMENYDIEKAHRHQFYEILFFHKGGGVHDIDFKTHTAYSRSIHFVAPDNVHLLLRAKNSVGCSLMFVKNYLDENSIEALPFNNLKPVLRPEPKNYTGIRVLLQAIESESRGSKIDASAMMKSQMNYLIQMLIREYGKEVPESGYSDKRPEPLRQFMKHLQANFHLHLSVKQYADFLHMSDKQLIEICKLHTGKTALKHIHEITVSEAKKLLFNSELSIKEIAYTLNFEDPANFSRFFKSVTGYSPLEYREGIR